MRVEELRIGNWVYCPFEFKEVKILQVGNILYYEIIEGNTDSCDFFRLSPISLSDEWFVKLGFKEEKFTFSRGNFYYHKRSKYLTWVGIIIHDSLWNEVHKLQNLYFALTGQELTIK
jgi:hypothetical protein